MRSGAFTAPLSQVKRSARAVAVLRGVTRAPTMTKFGHQTRLGQHFECPILVEIDHDGITRLSGADE